MYKYQTLSFLFNNKQQLRMATELVTAAPATIKRPFIDLTQDDEDREIELINTHKRVCYHDFRSVFTKWKVASNDLDIESIRKQDYDTQLQNIRDKVIPLKKDLLPVFDKHIETKCLLPEMPPKFLPIDVLVCTGSMWSLPTISNIHDFAALRALQTCCKSGKYEVTLHHPTSDSTLVCDYHALINYYIISDIIHTSYYEDDCMGAYYKYTFNGKTFKSSNNKGRLYTIFEKTFNLTADLLTNNSKFGFEYREYVQPLLLTPKFLTAFSYFVDLPAYSPDIQSTYCIEPDLLTDFAKSLA